MRSPSALWCLLVVLPIFPACAPPPAPPRFVIQYEANGPVIDGDAMWFTVVRAQGGTDSRVFAVHCPRTALSAAAPECDWHELSERTPESTSPATLARLAAAVDFECAVDNVSVQSVHPEGFWLAVCGRQRFYRLDGGRYVEQPRGADQPAP